MRSRLLGPHGKRTDRPRRTNSILFLGCLLAATACGSEAKPAPRGLVDPSGNPLSEKRAAAPAPEADEEKVAEPEFPSTGSSPFDVSPGSTAPSPAPGSAAPTPPPNTGGPSAAAAPAAAERDLSQELLALLPPPSSCLDFAKAVAQGGQLVISVDAMVMPSGAISRASVTAPGQSAAAVRCLETGVQTGSLKDQVPNAPLHVRASLTLDIVGQTPPTAPAPSAAPAPGPDVARPDGTEFAQPSD